MSYLAYENYIVYNQFLNSNYALKTEVNFVRPFYVSPSGNNTNTGITPDSPLLTFSKAISLGARLIYAFRGIYNYQNIQLTTGGDSFKILPYDNNEVYSHSVPNRQMITLNNGGEKLNSLVADGNGILSQSYAGGYNFQDVFINKTEIPYVAGGIIPRAVIWQNHIDATKDIRLKPVLTLAEVQSTIGSFTWDGTKIYINPITQDYSGFTVQKNAYGELELANFKEVVLEDFEVKYGSYNGINIMELHEC